MAVVPYSTELLAKYPGWVQDSIREQCPWIVEEWDGDCENACLRRTRAFAEGWATRSMRCGFKQMFALLSLTMSMELSIPISSQRPDGIT